LAWDCTIGRMTTSVLIAGGGIGGQAAALALARAGCDVRLFEQAALWSEAGAGIQLGPNATRLLHQWGLESALAGVAVAPAHLVVRNAHDGAQLAALRLGDIFGARYGAPYFTVHRADLHALLVQAASSAGASLQLHSTIAAIDTSPDGAVRLQLEAGARATGDALVGADGIWSRVRPAVIDDGTVQSTGHLAYRALLEQSALPAQLRSTDVTVWLGPRCHVVAYPVRRGDCLNLVAIVDGSAHSLAQEWDEEGTGADLCAALGSVCEPLQALAMSTNSWRLWSVRERPPLASANQMARGRVALLGDAAHPMRPYLAQGAAMALEDADALAAVLAPAGSGAVDVPAALQLYAQRRWQRCARVQRRAQRNGQVFHATGLLRWGRDTALRLLGERLLDLPWLYGQG
jgi:salicylate hydroxylase